MRGAVEHKTYNSLRIFYKILRRDEPSACLFFYGCRQQRKERRIIATN